MAFEEVAVICFSAVTCVALCAVAYFKSEERREIIRQQGIDRRAVGKEVSTSSPYSKQEWWVPLLNEALKIPAIQNIIAEKAGTLLKKE